MKLMMKHACEWGLNQRPSEQNSACYLLVHTYDIIRHIVCCGKSENCTHTRSRVSSLSVWSGNWESHFVRYTLSAWTSSNSGCIDNDKYNMVAATSSGCIDNDKYNMVAATSSGCIDNDKYNMVAATSSGCIDNDKYNMVAATSSGCIDNDKYNMVAATSSECKYRNGLLLRFGYLQININVSLHISVK